MKQSFNFREYPLAGVLDRLLEDKTTKKNIIWATDSYSDYGDSYCDRFEMRKYALLGLNPILLQPRAFKSQAKQQERTRNKAEVFTPTWIVNKMINQIDEEWFGRPDVFNIEEETVWKTKDDPIDFEKKSWKKYVSQTVLEVTCGEAPFIVSRYNAADGEQIPIKDRVGILDRKLRIINENIFTEEEWIKWAITAFKRVYGFEYQGDSLLIGRINLLLTFVEYYEDRWKKPVEMKLLNEIANIISWNLWQMDGKYGTVPLGVPQPEHEQLTLFTFDDEEPEDTAPLCKIYDWKTNNKSVLYSVIKKEGNAMPRKWDVIIGNPPYQESDGGNGVSARPVYNLFIDEAKKLNPKIIEMITPSRWFNGGKGLDTFRKTMLNDNHILKLVDYQNAKECFPGVSIGGGISYFLRDSTRTGPCEITNISNGKTSTMVRPLNEFETFIRSNEAVEIIQKVQNHGEKSITDLLSSRNPFGIATNVKGGSYKTPEMVEVRTSKGTKFIDRDLITQGKNEIDKFKCMISRATSEHAGEPDKDGKFKVIAKIDLLPPETVCTDSYIIGGSSDDEKITSNFMDYLKTKFARFLILQTLSSINLTKERYKFVPQQDFSRKWTDKDLYQKYGLNESEIDLIESTIKEME